MQVKIKAFLRKYTLRIFVLLVLAAVLTVSIIYIYNGYKYNYYEKVETKYGRNADIFASGFGTDNNGYAKNGAEVQKLIDARPSEQQEKFLEYEYYNRIYFGMNTMTERDEGTGNESPSMFNPQSLNTNQWCETLVDAGSTMAVLTVKYTDGFLLWGSEYTEHCIKNSPYKNGKGDILYDFSLSCGRYGLRYGIYLALEDKHEPTYGTPAYDDYIVNLLNEITDYERYGEVFYICLDTANGDGLKFDTDRYAKVIRKNQLHAIVNVTGGTEDVRQVDADAKNKNSVWSVGVGGADGSREALASEESPSFMQTEAVIPLRDSLFYRYYERPKSLKTLLQIYYRTVGANTNLCISVSVDKNGLMDNTDARRLREFYTEIDKSTLRMLRISTISVGNKEKLVQKDALDDLRLESSEYNYIFQNGEYIMEFTFLNKYSIGRIDLREDLRYSQRVEKFEIWIENSGVWTLCADAETIGNRRIFMLKNAPKTFKMRLVIRQSRDVPVLRSVIFYESL